LQNFLNSDNLFYMKNIINNIKNLLNSTFVPTYRITYAPEMSRNPHLPIQQYTIAGNPKHLAWRSKAGNKLFTALLPRKNEYASFRADRTLSVNFSGWALLSPKQVVAFQKTTAKNVAVGAAA
jgi:hypothetical protein